MSAPLTLMILNASRGERNAIKLALAELQMFHFIEMSDSQQALKYLKKHPVSMVITGLNVGDIDGWRFSRMIRSGLLETPKHTPIVLTPPFYCERIAETTARSYAIDAVVPIENSELLPEAVCNALSTQLGKSSRLNLLLFTEDDNTANEIKRALSLNFAIDSTTDKKIFLDKFSHKKYAIVLLDASSHNEKNAKKTIKKLFSHNSQQTIVTIIDSKDANYAEQLLLLGVTDFIRCPYDDALLIKVCEHAARREDFIISYSEFEKKVKQLSRSQSRYKSLFSAHQRILVHLDTVVIELDELGLVRFINPAWENLTGLSIKGVLGKRLSQYCVKSDVRTLKNTVDKLLKGKLQREKLELQFERYNDSPIWLECHFQAVHSDDSKTAVTASMYNIQERKQAELQLQHLALHDTLTGLHNRYYFDQQLSHYCQTIKPEQEHALLYIDIDHFKVINDSQGHQEGDAILKEIAQVIEGEIEAHNLLCRLGGDEFAIILKDTSLLEAHLVAENICTMIDGYHFSSEQGNYSLSCSIGIAQINPENADASECLKQADIALYVAKNQGRNLVHCYDAADSNNNAMQTGLEWGHAIRQALKEGSFELHYQAIWHIKKQRIAYYEALLRLKIDGQLVYPNQFIPALEVLNDSYLMDQCVIRKAIEDLSQHPEVQQVAINLSAQSLRDEHLLCHIKAMLTLYKVDPKRVIFEITESTSVDNLSATRDLVSQLIELGCLFSIDDFGTGFSTFNYLKQLPAQHVKIDGSFVRDMTNDPIDHALVKAINDIASSLDKSSVAEYVENKAIYNSLKEIDVDYAQGYFIAKPSPINELKNNQKIIFAKTSD